MEGMVSLSFVFFQSELLPKHWTWCLDGGILFLFKNVLFCTPITLSSCLNYSRSYNFSHRVRTTYIISVVYTASQQQNWELNLAGNLASESIHLNAHWTAFVSPSPNNSALALLST